MYFSQRIILWSWSPQRVSGSYYNIVEWVWLKCSALFGWDWLKKKIHELNPEDLIHPSY